MPPGMGYTIQYDRHVLGQLTAPLDQGPHRGLGALSTHGSVGEDLPNHHQGTTMVKTIHCTTAKDATVEAGCVSMQPGGKFQNIPAEGAHSGARAGYPQQMGGYTPMGITTRPLALCSAFHVAAAIAIGGLQPADTFEHTSLSSAISLTRALTASPL